MVDEGRVDAGAAEEPRGVAEAVAVLERDGYAGQFTVDAEGVRCPNCHRFHDAARGLVERVYRFEGISDPDDEAIVLGLRCPECGARGTVAAAYGPTADPTVADQLVLLDSRFRER
jgi:hypothetical protein